MISYFVWNYIVTASNCIRVNYLHFQQGLDNKYICKIYVWDNLKYEEYYILGCNAV
jgi:hypothetical protein